MNSSVNFRSRSNSGGRAQHTLATNKSRSVSGGRKYPRQAASPSLFADFKNESFHSDEDQSDSSKIKVYVRIRPCQSENRQSVRITAGEKSVIVNQGTKTLNFPCDMVFGENASQQEVYENLAKNLLTRFLEGCNVCMFAYGQTGSGKTHSILGSESDEGILPRFCRELFDTIADDLLKQNVFVEASFYELYLEKAYDLLPATRKPLRVRGTDAAYLENVTRMPLNRYNELASVLRAGVAKRATTATLVNEFSSRSHAIFQLTFRRNISEIVNGMKKQSVVCSNCYFVDLAGSERLDMVGHGNRAETANINCSLLALQKVIDTKSLKSSLSSASTFVNYRESVLTRLLKECFGGNSVTSLLATVNPQLQYTGVSIGTLRFASKAALVRQTPKPNIDPFVTAVKDLKAENDEMRAELEKFRSIAQQVSNNNNKRRSSVAYARRRRSTITKTLMMAKKATSVSIFEAYLQILKRNLDYDEEGEKIQKNSLTNNLLKWICEVGECLRMANKHVTACRSHHASNANGGVAAGSPEQLAIYSISAFMCAVKSLERAVLCLDRFAPAMQAIVAEMIQAVSLIAKDRDRWITALAARCESHTFFLKTMNKYINVFLTLVGRYAFILGEKFPLDLKSVAVPTTLSEVPSSSTMASVAAENDAIADNDDDGSSIYMILIKQRFDEGILQSLSEACNRTPEIRANYDRNCGTCILSSVVILLCNCIESLHAAIVNEEPLHENIVFDVLRPLLYVRNQLIVPNVRFDDVSKQLMELKRLLKQLLEDSSTSVSDSLRLALRDSLVWIRSALLKLQTLRNASPQDASFDTKASPAPKRLSIKGTSKRHILASRNENISPAIAEPESGGDNNENSFDGHLPLDIFGARLIDGS